VLNPSRPTPAVYMVLTVSEDLTTVHKHLIEDYLWGWARAAYRMCELALTSTDTDDFARLFDALLAVQAARNARRAAGKLYELHGSQWFPQETLRSFDDATADLKNLRDMSEYFDAYVTGEGRLQAADSLPIRVRFSKESGIIRVVLSDDREFSINLHKVKDDLAHLAIDLVVDLDAVEDGEVEAED
jgi:hypothetical protein